MSHGFCSTLRPFPVRVACKCAWPAPAAAAAAAAAVTAGGRFRPRADVSSACGCIEAWLIRRIHLRGSDLTKPTSAPKSHPPPLTPPPSTLTLYPSGKFVTIPSVSNRLLLLLLLLFSSHYPAMVEFQRKTDWFIFTVLKAFHHVATPPPPHSVCKSFAGFKNGVVSPLFIWLIIRVAVDVSTDIFSPQSNLHCGVWDIPI